MKPSGPGTPVAAALAFGLGLLPLLAGGRGSADILPPGERGVEVGIRLEWGPLASRLVHPVPTVEGDTWDAVAQRGTGDVAWATAVKGMNGGADVPPAPPGPVWVPPRGVTPGGGPEWYSAYVDFSKFGPDSDVSRTGLQRVDPGSLVAGAFGTVTVVVLPHRTPADAARSHDLLRARAAEWRAAVAEHLLLAAPSWRVASSVPEAEPVRRIEQTWRCEGVAEGALRLTLAREDRFDAKGAPLRAADSTSGLSTEWVAGAIAILVLAVLALWRARRGGKPPAPASP